MTPVRMRKANGERLVPQEKVAEYLELGYSVINSEGNVVIRPDPRTPAEFKQRIAEEKKKFAEMDEHYQKQIEDLQAEIAQLREENSALDARYAEASHELYMLKTSEKASDIPSVKPEATIEETPTETAETTENKPQTVKKGKAAQKGE